MRKILIAAAVASTAAFAVPAAAQYHDRGYDRGGWSQPAPRNAERQILRDIDRLQQRIDRSVQRGRLHRRDAAQLSRETQQVRQLFFRSSRNGLSQRQFVELWQRIDFLHHQLQRLERRR